MSSTRKMLLEIWWEDNQEKEETATTLILKESELCNNQFIGNVAIDSIVLEGEKKGKLRKV